ncbi:KICSTOR subunit 2-like [Macrosteles quadrilineatus]|uniref:KICSTOR subunit 2-like n=1 Tax=Macrosteles quadrilineatus TaxID=74068 RepID=UPI0023E29141|nr:KICSTOR subunit 2-like [Macrosteles quadrilineatus]
MELEYREDALQQIFTHISQLSLDKGLEQVEKLRDSTQPGSFKLLLNQIPTMIAAERSYVNLGFVTTKNKIFSRKDNSIRSMLESLRGELVKIEESSSEERTSVVTSQIILYITARIQLIDVYEKMYAMSVSSRLMKYEDLLLLVEKVVDTFALSHDALTPMKTAVSLECEILMLLLKAQIDIQNWRFLSTLLNLHGANSRIVAWEKILQSKESWKLGFGPSFLKVNPLPPLVQWLVKLKVATVNKFSLYFHHTLMQQTSPADFKTVCRNHNIDTYQRLQNIQRRYDAITAMLLFDTTGATDYGPAYQLPSTMESGPVDPYVIMVYCPKKLVEQLPTISKAISERSSELASLDRVVCCYSTKDLCSYFMTSLDPRVTMVFVFDSKKDEKETSLCKYIMELTVQLRTSNQIFSKLKLNN